MQLDGLQNELSDAGVGGLVKAVTLHQVRCPYCQSQGGVFVVTVGIGSNSFGLSFGLALINNRSSNAATKTLLKSIVTEYRGGCDDSANVRVLGMFALSF